ncbi:MAG: CocE/NonD family hydrolase [Myxococcota bacterium]
MLKISFLLCVMFAGATLVLSCNGAEKVSPSNDDNQKDKVGDLGGSNSDTSDTDITDDGDKDGNEIDDNIPDGGDGNEPDDEPDVEPDDDAGSDDDDVPLDCSEHIFSDIMLPMRDGKELSAFIRIPVNQECKLPAILIQTPYNKENAREIWFKDYSTEPLFASMDYAFVVVDWRGFFGSKDAKIDAEAQPYGEDGYDIVEWIASQSWSSGKVGTWGVSALGRQQYITAAEQPPHLAAAAPIFAEMGNEYEMYYPGGVLRKEYLDFIGWYFGGSTTVKAHPYRDVFWKYAESLADYGKIGIPMLVVAGWFDLYNTGVINTFNSLREKSIADVRGKHKLLVGGWHHFAVGSETSGAGRPLTQEELLYYDTERIIQKESLAFFDYYLRGVENGVAGEPPVKYFRTGEGEWAYADTWQPVGIAPKELYLTGEKNLATNAGKGEEIKLPYDPANPSPTIGGATLWWNLIHGPTDQKQVVERGDAVVFVTETLGAPLRIGGAITVSLAVKTEGKDTDFAVRLTDVDESGGHLLLDEGIQRLKLRDDLGKVSEVTANKRYEITIRMTNHLAYTFASGHRIGLIVTSSNYPRFDKNPNTGDDFFETAATPIAVINTIICDSASKLTIPVIE